jgi:hypothetical protein
LEKAGPKLFVSKSFRILGANHFSSKEEKLASTFFGPFFPKKDNGQG